MKNKLSLAVLGLAFCAGLCAGSARADAQAVTITVIVTVTPTPSPAPILSGFGHVDGIMVPGTNGAPATCFNAKGTPIPCSSLNPNAPKPQKAKAHATPRPTPRPTPSAASLR
jgi:hypothetical protein